MSGFGELYDSWPARVTGASLRTAGAGGPEMSGLFSQTLQRVEVIEYPGGAGGKFEGLAQVQRCKPMADGQSAYLRI